MSTFEHGGIQISFSERDVEFTASVGGKLIRKQSLAAMKAHIDKARASAFKPFSALVRPSWNTKANVKGAALCRVEVQSVEKVRGNKYLNHSHEFVISGYSNQKDVIEDTPQNIARFIEAKKHEQETSRIRSEREKKQRQLDESVVKIKADSMVKA
jgi:hypothetical protein